ncbi:pitrilysin family protein [Streptomyces sp. NPDC051582]|uniref:M16 family metallopeptidase n=1 Tax=Streptomyces sp. NPDC051582 TaxID=3155167 RepID=UPI003427D185
MSELQRFSLPNGLRVLLEPRPSAAVVAISVHYDVGFRSEVENRSGFAHLFEHLMFQGSENHAKMAHWTYVQGLGGSVNGSTHQDYTDYYQVLPSDGLEQVLSMEMDRMHALLITEENLCNQRAVVKEEIRLNILNRAYGGFPWIPLPALLYNTYPNTHDGYGAFEDLDSASVADAVDFYRAHYVPANAVLTVCGAFDPDRTAAYIEEVFGALPHRPKPAPAMLREELPRTTRHGRREDVHASLPALALGYQLPDPGTELDAYLAHMVLCEILTGGSSSRLHTRLVREKGTAVHVSAGCGLFNALDTRAPDTLALAVTHHPHTDPESVLAEIDGELAGLAETHALDDLVPTAGARVAARSARRNADLLARTRAMGTYELLHNAPALVDELPGRILTIGAEAVTDAARALLTDQRAVLRLVTSQAVPRQAAEPTT